MMDLIISHPDVGKGIDSPANASALTLTTIPYNKTDTGDIVKAGCFVDPFSVIACTRYAVMCLIIAVTGVLCLYRIIRLHLVRHEAFHHYFIFYSSLITCIFCLVHWMMGTYAQLDFIAQWFKQLCYLVVTHFFWTRAHRALRTLSLVSLCLYPSLVLGFVYCTIIVVIGIVTVNDYKDACLAIYWVLMSSAEVLIAQMFLVAGTFISKRLDRISTVQSVRTSQKRKLWGLVVVFEISAVAAFSYDLSMKILGDPVEGCGKIFNYNQLLYSIIFGSFMIIKFALPIWALLAALEPIESQHIDEVEETSSFQSSDSVQVLPGHRHFPRPKFLRSANSNGRRQGSPTSNGSSIAVQNVSSSSHAVVT